MKRAVKASVKGTVQGIFFRQFVKGHADDLKLVGFVRNLCLLWFYGSRNLLIG